MKNPQNASNIETPTAVDGNKLDKPVNWKSISLAVLVAGTIALIAVNQVGIFAF